MPLHPVTLWVTKGCFIPCGCLPKLLTCAQFSCYCMWCWCARSSVWVYGCNIKGRRAATMMLWALLPFLLLIWNFTVPQTTVRGPPWGTIILCSIVSDPIKYWQVPSCCLMSWLKIHWKLAQNNHLTRPICLLLFCCYPCNFQLFHWIHCLYHMILLVCIGEINPELGPWLVASKMAFSIHPAAVLILIMILVVYLLEMFTLHKYIIS